MTLTTPSKQRHFEKYTPLVILRLASYIAAITYLNNLWEPPVTGRSLMLWALLLLPFVWIAVCPRKWIATAVGTALGAFAINAPALLLLLLFFSVAAPKFSSDMIFLVMQIPLLIAALLVWIKEPVAKAKIVLPFAVAAFLYYYAADRSPLIGPGHGAGPETTYVVRSVDKCAIQYAAGHQGNYPDDLRELGPNGSGCLSADIARGNSDGLRLAYSRQVKGFQVFADNHSFWRDGRRTVGLMYSDQSGVIRGNVNKDRPGSSGSELYDLEGSVPGDLQRAAQCLLKHGQPYPVDLQSLSGPGGCLPAGGTWMREANYLQQYGYVLTYEAKVNPTPGVHAFEINARPVPYGRWGLRSFYVDDNGVVRATPEDRPANTQDPPAR